MKSFCTVFTLDTLPDTFSHGISGLNVFIAGTLCTAGWIPTCLKLKLPSMAEFSGSQGGIVFINSDNSGFTKREEEELLFLLHTTYLCVVLL